MHPSDYQLRIATQGKKTLNVKKEHHKVALHQGYGIAPSSGDPGKQFEQVLSPPKLSPGDALSIFLLSGRCFHCLVRDPNPRTKGSLAHRTGGNPDRGRSIQ